MACGCKSEKKYKYRQQKPAVLRMKYEFTDGRIRCCHKCCWQFWIGRKLFCKVFLKNMRNLWDDPITYIVDRARIENEHCPLKKW